MPECLHDEIHDHIICIFNLWAYVARFYENANATLHESYQAICDHQP